MDPSNGTRSYGSAASLADAHDLRSAIAAALSATPVDEQLLRRGVWTYVDAERHAGMSSGRVIMAISEMVESAEIFPMSVRQTVLRHVILWCVEAYFGHLGGDMVGRNGKAFSALPTPLPIGRSL